MDSTHAVLYVHVSSDINGTTFPYSINHWYSEPATTSHDAVKVIGTVGRVIEWEDHVYILHTDIGHM